MLVFVLFCICSCVQGRCIWRPPETMFPERLLHLKMDREHFYPRRRLASAITVINGKPNNMKPVILNVAAEKNAERIKHSNAVPGHAHYRTNKFRGGFNNQGSVEYSVVFDKRFATPDMLYSVVDVIPSIFYSDVDLLDVGPEIDVVNFKRETLSALEFVDVVRVGVGVHSPCLPEHELGRVYYDFNVSATYDLYHSYDNALVSNDQTQWSNRGWIGKASIMLYPPINFTGSLFNDYLDTPCFGSRIESSLEVLNTSQFTYWDLDTFSYQTDTAFIGDASHSIPRCHRRHAGNVCVVLAKVRLTHGICPRPVSFSVHQSVSHIARMSTRLYTTEEKPSDFDASRRAPVPDGQDMRYDMCEARACESPDKCHPFHIENDGLKADSGIYINQYDTQTGSYIETICTFEVIGFLDDIWSPHIYFRQWVGFNYTVL